MNEIPVSRHDDVDVDVGERGHQAHRVNGHLDVDRVLEQRSATLAKNVDQLDAESIEIGLVLVHVLHAPVRVRVGDQNSSILVRQANHRFAVDILFVDRPHQVLEVDQEGHLALRSRDSVHLRPVPDA